MLGSPLKFTRCEQENGWTCRHPDSDFLLCLLPLVQTCPNTVFFYQKVYPQLLMRFLMRWLMLVASVLREEKDFPSCQFSQPWNLVHDMARCFPTHHFAYFDLGETTYCLPLKSTSNPFFLKEIHVSQLCPWKSTSFHQGDIPLNYIWRFPEIPVPWDTHEASIKSTIQLLGTPYDHGTPSDSLACGIRGLNWRPWRSMLNDYHDKRVQIPIMWV